MRKSRQSILKENWSIYLNKDVKNMLFILTKIYGPETVKNGLYNPSLSPLQMVAALKPYQSFKLAIENNDRQIKDLKDNGYRYDYIIFDELR